ncbi:hypothetical protein ACKJVF_003783 [Salmonella enterica subsp. enterica serovar Kentucky]|nr:hypothetical protein [Salmonella enterica]EGG2795321.1 hypothetical protein [Salmonella enterica subsp. enterica serovar Kentucky]EKP1882975.1 hypothetical protein [Salmonella enterica subsp. enterica serovar Kentucky]EKZ7384634.1 hypothetical protein [Salmonella enterica subsp. enterica serovar Kentucky]ELH4999587.1 hypothetical protein [Salmonella enterica subsp. enterica serovar Kentucky]
MTTVYVTKYALSDGPFKVEAELSFGGTMASYRIGNSYTQTAHGKDFWLTEAEAMADCERRRTAKLASIEKQRKKLEAMQFTIN